MTPLAWEEDGAARLWLAARTMRVPLVALKFGSPLLVIATLVVIVRQPNLAAQPLHVLYLLALPFGVPFLLGLVYPFVRLVPQHWTLDAAGVHGRGRVRTDYPWSDVVWWGTAEVERLPSHVCVVIVRGSSRELVTRLFVPHAARDAVEAWIRASALTAQERAVPALD